MSMGMNPWLAMWTQPRNAIRALIQENPKYGVFYLSSIYALQSFFYFANYWSLGLAFSFYMLLVIGVIVAPIAGMGWAYAIGWALHLTGKWLNGKAPMFHLRSAAAWSKIPMALSLIMWLILLATHPEYAFIQDAGGPTSFFIQCIAFILSIWSFVLLVQAIRELQHFSLRKAFCNALLVWAFFALLSIFALILFRIVYF